MRNDLSKLLDQALNEIQTLPQIQALLTDQHTEDSLATLPYAAIMDIELLRENGQAEVAIALLRQMQASAAEMITNYQAGLARLEPVLTHPMVSKTYQGQFREKLRQCGVDMLIRFYTSMGVSKETAIALAQWQIM